MIGVIPDGWTCCTHLHRLIDRNETRCFLGSVAKRSKEPVGVSLPESVVHPVEDVQEARTDVELRVGEVDEVGSALCLKPA